MTCPTAAVSHVMLEAYKKYLLVGLLVHGDRPKDSSGALGLPKFTSAIVGKFLKPLCVPYSEIVTAYHGSTAEELRAVVAKYQVVFFFNFGRPVCYVSDPRIGCKADPDPAIFGQCGSGSRSWVLQPKMQKMYGTSENIRIAIFLFLGSINDFQAT